MCLPAAVLAGPGGGVDVVALVCGTVLALAALAARVGIGPAAVRSREIVGTGLLAGAIALFAVLVGRSELPVADFVGLAAALGVSMATIRRDPVRWSLQIVTLATVAALLLRDATGLDASVRIVAVGGPVLLLLAVTVLASALAGDLELARRREVATRRSAERRTEVLTTVRQLVRGGADAAVDAVVAAVGVLGFEVAAVGLVDDAELVPYRTVGVRWTSPLPVDHGHIGEALRTDSTQTFRDYRADADAIEDLRLGTVVIVPIRVQGRPEGVVIAARRTPGPPSGDTVDLLEVLTAHLGAALQAGRREATQAVLLGRLRDLEALRSRFVAGVTEDIRDPLTVVQGAAETLVAHADRLPADARHELLGRLTAQASTLEATLEALLDFSRDQRAQGDPDPVAIEVAALVGPALAGSALTLEVDEPTTVLADVSLVRRAVELLRRGGLDEAAGVRAARRGREMAVTFDFAAEGLEQDLTRALAEQLIVAAGGRTERTATGLVVLLPAVAMTSANPGARP